MFESFVNPALVFGTALASVPLIIHLLNRQRHKPMRWAAMRFVIAAYRKTRRRVQLENLLLLLLRMAAVAFLALAVARPFASGDSPLATLTEDRRDVVLVLDGSASTGYREDIETVFERIVQRANDIVSSLDEARGDRVRLILAGDYPRLLSWTSPDKALAVLTTLQRPTDEALDLAAAMGEVLDFVEKDAAGTGRSALEVRLFTDLQRRVFEAPAASQEQTEGEGESAPLLLKEQLDAIAAFYVKVLVEDLGPAPSVPGNLSVAAVTPLQTVIGAGVPVEIGVTVANHGNTPRAAVRLALEVDGVRQPIQRVDIPARGSYEAVFTLQFPEAGAHALVAHLEGDRLAVDDQRPHVLSVPTPIRILVVNGARASEISDDETGYLMAVLEPPDDSTLPGIGGTSPFDPREITPDVLADPDLDLAGYDVIVMANVGTLTDAVVQRLEERVAAGASLIVTMGDRVGQPAGQNPLYTHKLFAPDGSGLLPGEVMRRTAVASRRDSYYRVSEFKEDHPALAFFAEDVFRPLLTEVPVYEFVVTRPIEAARVLARLDDEGRSPLLIERTYLEGRVFLWTTTIDPEWTRLPESPNTLVPFVHELLRYAGERRVPARNIAPGEPVTVEVGAFPRSPELVRPDRSRRPVDGEPVESAHSRWRLPEVSGTDTERSGLYRIEIESARAEPFAVQIDPAESDLAHMAGAELADVHPALVALERGETERSQDDDDEPRRGEIWRWLALAAFIALVGESLWGAWLGYKRRLSA